MKDKQIPPLLWVQTPPACDPPNSPGSSTPSFAEDPRILSQHHASAFEPSLQHVADLTPEFTRVGEPVDKEVADFDYRLSGKAGDLYWFHGDDALFAWNATGHALRTIGTAIALEGGEQPMERHEKNNVQENFDQKLRAIFDGTQEYLGLIAPDGTLLEANRASLALAASNRDEVIGMPFWKTVWFQYTPGAPEAVRDLLAVNLFASKRR